MDSYRCTVLVKHRETVSTGTKEMTTSASVFHTRYLQHLFVYAIYLFDIVRPQSSSLCLTRRHMEINNRLKQCCVAGFRTENTQTAFTENSY